MHLLISIDQVAFACGDVRLFMVFSSTQIHKGWGKTGPKKLAIICTITVNTLKYWHTVSKKNTNVSIYRLKTIVHRGLTEVTCEGASTLTGQKML